MMAAGGKLKDHAYAITTSANGKQIYANLMQMPLAGNISRNPHLLRLTEEALESVQLTGPGMQLEHDMGRTVGYSELVDTVDNDAVFYACQTKTSGYTRFVKNGKTEATQRITMVLVCDEDGDYELQNIWIGNAYPPAPGEPGETADSKAFWQNHAVLYNGQSLVSNTVTKTCPY